MRLLIARELGDYISTSYIEKILAEKYPAEKKKDKEQSTCQIAEIPRNDDRIHIEVSTTGESIGDDDHLDNTITNSYDTDHKSSEEAQTEFKSNLELQAEEGTKEIVRSLQKQVSHLQTKCFQLNQLAQERAMWEEKRIHLQQELNSYKNKIIKGDTQIEFGSELLPIKIEYNFRTGAVSLMLTIDPRLTPSEVDEIIKMTSENIDHYNQEYSGLLGAGKINVYKALTEVKRRFKRFKK